MDKLNELEQLKNEYKEIPIPEHAVAGVQAAIERAKQKKRLRKRVVRYTAMAAAAMLIIWVAPKDMFMMKAANDAVSSDLGAEGVKDRNGGASYEDPKYGYDMEDAVVNHGVTLTPTQEEPVTSESETVGPFQGVESESTLDEVQSYEALLATEEARIKISEEIKRQIRTAMESGKEYFTVDAALSESFECIAKDQEYYINEEGLLVIVFAPGEVAPSVYGPVEFVIPEEVLQ